MTTTLIKSDLYPAADEWAMMKEQASMVVPTGLLPRDVNTPQKAIAIMLKGREIGMPMMQAFSHINIIQGKPTLSSEGMLALIFKSYPTTKLTYLKNDDEACQIKITKPGNEPSMFTFTFEDAQKAKLTGKQNWSTYRRAMLRSRCISEMARSLFPEALMGCSYTPEELQPDVPIAAVVPVREYAEPLPIAAPTPAVTEYDHKMDRLGKMVHAFGALPDGYSLSRYDLQGKCGERDIEEFTDADMDVLKELYSALSRQEITADQVRNPQVETIADKANEIDNMFGVQESA